MYNKVDVYYLPREEFKKSGIVLDAEMTEWESSFLCGLLRKFKPNKIVDVAARGLRQL